MTIGLLGKKVGMTRLFAEDGASIPVSVVAIDRHTILQRKTKANDGYDAIQVGVGEQLKRSKVNMPLEGHCKKVDVTPPKKLLEFRLNEKESTIEGFVPGKQLSLEQFSVGQLVDVSGTTIGKGFAGTVKRHNFATQDATHGNSLSHRVPGSIGQRQTPGRVFKGKRMSGHMGNVKQTIQNLAIAGIDKNRDFILIKGAIPGSRGGWVIIKPAVKSADHLK